MGHYKDSLGIEILKHLNKSGRIPRKNLYTPFVSYSYRYYARVVQQLLEEGCVKVERFGRRNCISITEVGTEVLAEMYEDDDEEAQAIQSEKAKARSAKARKRKKLVADVEGLCVANGFLVSAQEKPSLLELAHADEGSDMADELEEEFSDAMQAGVYYSTRELRSAYIAALGKNEIANWTRLVGIVLYKGNLSFLYSVDKTLIKWLPANEKRTVDFLIDFLRKIKIVSRHVVFEKHPICMVCGEGMTMVPKIVTGRKWGRTDSDKNSERYKAKLAATHINSHNLAKIYSAAYYVPVNKTGVDMFRLAAVLSEATREQLANHWFSELRTATRLMTLRYHQGVTTNGKRERVVYIPCIDLIELEYLAQQGTPCHVVAPKGTQQAISRVLGTLVLSIRSLEGERLHYNSFENGAPVNNTSAG